MKQKIVKETFSTGAQKELTNKLRMDLIPPEVYVGYAEVLTFGADGGKYSDRNWEKGIPFYTCVGSLLRHLVAFMMGEDINKESGLSHMKHVLFWVGAIVTFIERKRTDLDNRIKS